MARPVGRYFASVVSQIRKLKNDEVIVVDNSFKSKLRTQLIARIGAVAPASKQTNFNPFEFLKNHVAQFAGFAFMAVVVVVSANSLIRFNSSKDSKTDTTSQIIASVDQNKSQSIEQTDFDGPPIKTFPARLVFPPKMLAKIYQEESARAPEAKISDAAATKTAIVQNKANQESEKAIIAQNPPNSSDAAVLQNDVPPNAASDSGSSSVVFVEPTMPAASTAVQEPAAIAPQPKILIYYAFTLSAARKVPLEKAVYENAAKIGIEVWYVSVFYKDGKIILEFHLKNRTVKQINYIEQLPSTRANP